LRRYKRFNAQLAELQKRGAPDAEQDAMVSA
jgi:hypothetical protein